jgi:hypothetical protein
MKPRKPDPALLKAIARARVWFDELATGRVRSLVEIARREGLPKRYVTRLAKLAFVSPMFVDAIAEGQVSPETNLQMLMDGRIALPIGWEGQEQLFSAESSTSVVRENRAAYSHECSSSIAKICRAVRPQLSFH